MVESKILLVLVWSTPELTLLLIFSALQIVPWGFRRTLNYIKEKYDDPEIIITENGFPDDGKLEDTERVEYLAVSGLTNGSTHCVLIKF